MYKTILLRNPQTSKILLMKKEQNPINALLYYFNGRSIKKMKLNSVIIISVLTNLITFVKEF